MFNKKGGVINEKGGVFTGNLIIMKLMACQGLGNRERVARAQYRRHLVLERLGKHDKGVEEVKNARMLKCQILKENEGYLSFDPGEVDPVIFDQLCSRWESCSNAGSVRSE